MTQIRVKYIIPEDGDDIEHPNVFTLPSSVSSNNITLNDIKKSFPLSTRGEYHFRFLKALNPENKVWLDITNDTDVLPIVNGAMFAKVSRITNGSINVNNTNNSISPTNRVQPTVAPPVLHQPHQEGNLLGDDLGYNSTPKAVPLKPVRTISASSSAPAVNLLDTGDFSAATSKNNDLLDMSMAGHNSAHVDLFGSSPPSFPNKTLQQAPIMHSQQPQQRGIGISQQQSSPQQTQRVVGMSQQQEQRKESPPQQLRGKTHDAFSGLGDFKM